MQLKELVKQLPVLRVEGSLDREVAGIVYDSRRVTPGMVFVAIPGNARGWTRLHQHAPSSAARQPSSVSAMVSALPRATKIKVPDVREALARAASSFYHHPSTKLQVIGVTGTNGKTTVAFMVKEILQAAGIKTGLLGTVRYEIGERVIPANRTTPESLEIHEMMAQMVTQWLQGVRHGGQLPRARAKARGWY